jgi:hypothetical protein
LERLTGIYYRRPTRISTATDADGIAEWTAVERRWGLWGLLAALPRHRWLNWAPAVDAAELKPVQLVQALSAGLSVPATAITNLPDAARDFAKRTDPVLYKPFRSRPVTVDGEVKLVYATQVTPEQCGSDSVETAPVMLQALVHKAFDVRVTVVERELFAVTPRWADGAIPLDWRIDHDANVWEPVEVPTAVRSRLLMMLDSMGLRFAATDFTVDHDGRWHFLDLNPAGQWAWDHPLRDDIADAIADALTREDM